MCMYACMYEFFRSESQPVQPGVLVSEWVKGQLPVPVSGSHPKTESTSMKFIFTSNILDLSKNLNPEFHEPSPVFCSISPTGSIYILLHAEYGIQFHTSSQAAFCETYYHFTLLIFCLHSFSVGKTKAEWIEWKSFRGGRNVSLRALYIALDLWAPCKIGCSLLSLKQLLRSLYKSIWRLRGWWEKGGVQSTAEMCSIVQPVNESSLPSRGPMELRDGVN